MFHFNIENLPLLHPVVFSNIWNANLLNITYHIEGGAGLSCATKMGCHTSEFPSSAEVEGGGIEVQPWALAVGTIPGLSVARYTAWSKRRSLSISTFKLPVQLKREGGKARRLTLNS